MMAGNWREKMPKLWIKLLLFSNAPFAGNRLTHSKLKEARTSFRLSESRTARSLALRHSLVDDVGQSGHQAHRGLGREVWPREDL